jgi:predicted secreted protein
MKNLELTFLVLMLLSTLMICNKIKTNSDHASITLVANQMSELTVNQGDAFDVLLSGNPTTGYNWYLIDSQNLKILRAENLSSKKTGQFISSQSQSGPIKLGKGGKLKFVFRAVVEGEETLNFAYRRYNEEDTDGRQASVKISINPPA